MKVLFPVINEEFGTRLFDADLVAELRLNVRDESAILKELADLYSELYQISVPGFRFPNPSASVAGAKAFVNRRIWEAGEDLCRERANPTTPYDSLSFADKVSEQLAFVSAMPRFSATDEEIADDNARYSRYVRSVTAEAEIIILWNSL